MYRSGAAGVVVVVELLLVAQEACARGSRGGGQNDGCGVHRVIIVLLPLHLFAYFAFA